MKPQIPQPVTSSRQRGVVLIVALIFLVVLTLLGITAMSTNTLEERMAGNEQAFNRAFQAAETGLSTALDRGDFVARVGAENFVSSTQAVGTYGSVVYFASFRNTVPLTGRLSEEFLAGQTGGDTVRIGMSYVDFGADAQVQGGATEKLRSGGFAVTPYY